MDTFNIFIASINDFSPLILAFLTLVLIIYTRRLAIEARKQRRASISPHIVVSIEINTKNLFLELVIENVGNGPAYDVAITAQPDLTCKLGSYSYQLRSLKFLNIKLLKQRQKISHLLSKWEQLNPKEVTFHCCCKDLNNNSHEFTNSNDLSVFEGLRIQPEPLESIAKETKRLANDVHKVISGSNHLKIDTYTASDRQREENELEQHYLSFSD